MKMWLKLALAQLMNWELRKCFYVSTLFCAFLLFAAISAASNAKGGGVHAFDHFRDCDTCSEMVVLPAGSYEMGATEQEFQGKEQYRSLYLYEIPRHLVAVRSFALAKFNVTRGQFDPFVRETGFRGKGCRVFKGGGWVFDPNADWSNPGFKQTNYDPVVCVSWDDANKYIDWLNSKVHKNTRYRLPTEEEWEYAARAGTVTAAYWGNNAQDQCRYENAGDISLASFDSALPYANCDDSFVYTAPVGSYKPNPWGLFDMLGNAAQWVEDCPDVGYHHSPIVLDKNSDACEVRALRGASWSSIPIGVRSASRGGMTSSVRESVFGFRLAVDVLPN